MRLHKTKGIVLRTVRYGETSLVVTIYTEAFGTQSYLINGVRKSSKKGSGKANLFQPASILELIVYHNELRQLNRVREFKWSYLYQHIFFDVRKNAVALFMIELLQKCLKQPEHNAELFYFIEDAFVHLDTAPENVVANYPLFFALHFMMFAGFRMDDNYTEAADILDLQEGMFRTDRPSHPYFLEGQEAYITSQLLKVMQPAELEQLQMNQAMRRRLMHSYQEFYAYHIADFGQMKSLPVLQEVLA
ncbi:MAG: DNA repair protein RecO [Chitinophagaceae bacterium]